MLKRVLCVVGFILMCASHVSYASSVRQTPAPQPQQQSQQPPQITLQSLASSLYAGLVSGTNYVFEKAKKHPFLTVGIAILFMSKKTRKALWKLPANLWIDIQEYPVAMALLGGFLLNYILA